MTDKKLDTLLHDALCPEIDPVEVIVHPRKGKIMNTQKRWKTAVIVAAVILLMVTTAYASGILGAKTLMSNSLSKAYDSYDQMDHAMKDAGFTMDAPETLPGGFQFAKADLQGVDALDEADTKLFSYQRLSVWYEAEDRRLSLTAFEAREELQDSDFPPMMEKSFDGITAAYRKDHYKFVPEGYELTEEDQENLQKPYYYLSYGADEIYETDTANITWEKDGIHYALNDFKGAESAETLFSIAEALICG